MNILNVVIGAALSFGSFAPYQESVSLERKYAEGSQDRFSLRLNLETPVGTADISVTTLEKVLKVYPNGDADVEVAVLTLKATIGGKDTQPGQPPKPEKTIVRRDKFGVPIPIEGKAGGDTKDQGGGLSALQGYLTIGALRELPLGKAVEVQWPDPQDRSKKVRLTGTLESLDKGVARIVSVAEIASPGPKTTTVRMTTFWDTASRKLVKAEGTISGIGEGSMPSETAQFTIERLKE